MFYTHSMRSQREAIADWVAHDGYTHAITLNTDRELTPARLKDIFSTFCHCFDKRAHGIRNMQRLPSAQRLRAVVFPENLSTNAHLHGLADFTSAITALGSEKLLQSTVRSSWLIATKGAGSVDVKADPDRGWASYVTKRFSGTYFLAADFHPQ